MTNEEAIKELNYIADEMPSMECADWKEAIYMAIKALEQEPKTGHWISHREHCENLGVMPSGLGAYKWCSNCDCGIDVKEWHRSDYNYCPNCGVKMESEE